MSSRQQWEQCITYASTREQWGDLETVTTKVAKQWMGWLGHLVRISDVRTPKEDAVWLATQDTTSQWTPEEMEGCGPT